MATTRFKTTMDAIHGGVQNFAIDKAVQNIEGWEDYLGKHDQEGVKAVVQDLAKLKKLLQSKEIDGEAVKKLIAKMGKDTVKVAGDGESADAKHIRELGEALSQAVNKKDEEPATPKLKKGDKKDVAPAKQDDEVEEEDEDEDDDEEVEDDDEEVEDDDEEVEDDDEDDNEDDEDDEQEDEAVEEPVSPPAKKTAAKKAPAKGKK